MTEQTASTAIIPAQNPLPMAKMSSADTRDTLARNIQAEGLQVYEMLTEPSTAAAYQTAAKTTLVVLKKVLIILFFSLMLLFALVVWTWGIGFQLGTQLRKDLEENPPSSFTDMVKGVYGALGKGFTKLYAWAADFVHKALGWSFDLSDPAADPSPAPPEENMPSDDADSPVESPARTPEDGEGASKQTAQLELADSEP